MSSSYRIISKDVVKSASNIVATSTAGGTSISNCKNDRKTSFWKSTSLSEQTVTITWTTAQAISGIGLPFNNLIVGSTVNVKLYTNSGDPSPVFETGNISVDFAYSTPFGFTTIGTDSFTAGGGNFFSAFFAEQPVKEIKMVLNSSGNPDGHIALARIVAGVAYDVTSGIDFGSSANFLDTTETLRRGDGVLISEDGRQYMNHRLISEQLSDSDAAILWSINRQVGNSIPIYVSALDDESGEYKTLFQTYGVIENNFNLNAYAFDKNGTILQVVGI